ncbi:mandelate racemase/muconate lactonizing enzyme family protein [Streptomyces sp. NPDC048565]|uniref:mandelate racemase/muconate lactonizing enzyme family protein n=1 Tax=Streptomyces sp. NPDC048565 TaxID=3155266 RepID=UPI0034373F7C
MNHTERIRSVEIFHIANPSLRPTIVRIRTDAGTVGLGDCGVSYGAGAQTMPHLLAELARDFVVGRSLADRHRILTDLTYGTFWAKRAGALMSGAISALDQALQDATARSLGVPLYELLGGKVRDTVPVYANGWYFGHADDDAQMKAACRAVDDGHEALKLYPMAWQDEKQRLRHPGPDAFDQTLLRRSVERVRRLRQAVGADTRIMADLSGSLPRDVTPTVLHELAGLDVEFVEEPFNPADDGSLDWIGRGSPVLLAAGERYYGLQPFDRALSSGAIHILQPDICLVGGHGVFQSVAALALSHSVRISPHNCASGIATAHTLQAAATVANLHSVETFPYLHTVPGYHEILTEPLERHIRAGQLVIPDGSGIGVDLDDAIVSRFLADTVEASQA